MQKETVVPLLEYVPLYKREAAFVVVGHLAHAVCPTIIVIKGVSIILFLKGDCRAKGDLSEGWLRQWRNALKIFAALKGVVLLDEFS